jgi:DNA polymerase III delta prime subunit
MNFNDFQFSDDLKGKLNNLTANGRLPHSIIITGGNNKLREDIALFLCHYAMCFAEEKPCFSCRGCHKVASFSHPDIFYVEPDAKRKNPIYSKDVVKDVIAHTANVPNEGNLKIFVFRDVDERLPVISQNALLKTLEEPTQKILFLLLCKSADNLLETIISRCSAIDVPVIEDFDEKAVALATEVALSMVDVNEYSLLKATYKLNKKDVVLQILPPLKAIIRDALVLSVGGNIQKDNHVAKKLIRKLTREKLLDILNILNKAQKMAEGNVNMNILSTWLCSEFRRIIWQK